MAELLRVKGELLLLQGAPNAAAASAASFTRCGRGNDVLKGGADNDRLFGQRGDDAMDGGPRFQR